MTNEKGKSSITIKNNFGTGVLIKLAQRGGGGNKKAFHTETDSSNILVSEISQKDFFSCVNQVIEENKIVIKNEK